MADTPEKIRRGVGRVAFLARLEEFRKLVDAGWPITCIYEDHGASTGLSYSQFVRYIGKYLRTPPTRNRGDEQPDAQSEPDTTPETISRQHVAPQQPKLNPPPSKPVSAPKGRAPFHHDPTSGNSRDDLI
jgi:hypothetical protein